MKRHFNWFGIIICVLVFGYLIFGYYTSYARFDKRVCELEAENEALQTQVEEDLDAIAQASATVEEYWQQINQLESENAELENEIEELYETIEYSQCADEAIMEDMNAELYASVYFVGYESAESDVLACCLGWCDWNNPNNWAYMIQLVTLGNYDEYSPAEAVALYMDAFIEGYVAGWGDYTEEYPAFVTDYINGLAKGV